MLFFYKNKKGFTLVELLMVVAIIGLLSSVALTSLNSARNKAKIAKVQTEVNQIYKAFSASTFDLGSNYLNKSDTSGQYSSGVPESVWYVPDCTTANNYTDGDDRPNGEYVKQWATALNNYMKDIPLDPWGNPYWIDSVYLCTAGESSKCSGGSWYYAIGSGGPNKSGINIYDSDNVVAIFCKHP